MAEWEVARSSGRCQRCDAEFKEGQDFYTALRESEEGFERRDFCPTCWEGDEPAAFCFWKTRVPPKETKQRLLVDDGVLINFFERLADQTEPLRVRFRFVLALILMRKKLLRYERTVREDDREVWIMRLTGSDGEHRVENPSMDDDQIAEVSGQLGVILRGEASAGPDDLVRDIDEDAGQADSGEPGSEDDSGEDARGDASGALRSGGIGDSDVTEPSS